MAPTACTLPPRYKTTLFATHVQYLVLAFLVALVVPETSTFVSALGDSTPSISSPLPADHPQSGHRLNHTSSQLVSTLQADQTLKGSTLQPDQTLKGSTLQSHQTSKSSTLPATASSVTNVSLPASPSETMATLVKADNSSLSLTTPSPTKQSEAVTTVGTSKVLLLTTNQGETPDTSQSVVLPTTTAGTTHSSQSAAQPTTTFSAATTVRDGTLQLFPPVTQVSALPTKETTVTSEQSAVTFIKPPSTRPTTPTSKPLSTLQPHFFQGTVTILPPVTDSSTEREPSRSHSAPSTSHYVSRIMTLPPIKSETAMVSRQPIRYFSLPAPRCPTTGKGRPEEMKGSITWAYNHDTCIYQYSWRIQVPESYGIVVEFHKVDMQDNDNLTISSAWEDGNTLLRSFTQKRWDVSPLLLRERVMEVEVTTPSKTRRQSSFNLSYVAHPVDSVPTYLVIENDAEDTESMVIYQCGGITELPEAITCDGIHHCERGEDEANCSQDQGCGTWFSFNDRCYKATFRKVFRLIPGHSTSTMPLHAEAVCREKYNGTLATLQEPGEMDMAVRMIRNSGFKNAAIGIRKVNPVSERLRHLYRFLWQWGGEGSPIAYEQVALQRLGVIYDCAMLVATQDHYLQPLACVLPGNIPNGYICMKPNPLQREVTPPLSGLLLTMESSPPEKFPVKSCPDGSVVQTFHLCQWGERKEDEEDGWSPNNLPLFQCRYGRAVHYSLLCDGNSDCADGSDELGCRQPQFAPLLRSSFICRNFQAIPAVKRCDGSLDCFDESDEKSCVSCGAQVMCPGVGCVAKEYAELFPTCPSVSASAPPDVFPHFPGSVKLDGTGMSTIVPAATAVCGEGFYPCRSGYCIPSFLLNNGEQDCPQGEDEHVLMTNLTCPGYYRCQNVGNCVHPRYLCDGIYHCPNKDDEMFCHVTCPRDRGCVCEGQAYTCSSMIDPLQNLHVRYLDLSQARNVSLENIQFMEYLVFLNLSSCGLDNVTLADMPQLQTLDLSYNLLTRLTSLSIRRLPGLLYLDLSNNLFAKTLGAAFSTVLHLGELHHLKTLIMTNVSLEVIGSKALSTLSRLQHLDIRLNPVHSFDKDSLWGLTALQDMYTDGSKLCCSYFYSCLPRCHAPVDELSSCSDLLGQDFFRVFLWSLSALALAGNAGVLIYRVFISKQKSATSSQILVKHLCASDLLMGVYMMIIGVADAQFHGVYVAKEKEWTKSVACTAAGFLSFVSSEVSAFMVCLVTLERVLVICFPFNIRLHPGSRVAAFSCCVVWVVGITLAAVPLIAGIEFYGQNGICIPLPITRQQFSGQTYAFGVFIVLNFVVFVLIGAGQVLIYRSVHNASKAAGSQRREQDLAIARRLFLIVLTDFCCWFPIGLMGLLASTGIPIPGEVNVWAAIFVLPLNSALNPFLYTLNGLTEKWKNKRMEKRTRKMLGKLQTEIPKWQPGSVAELIKICVQSRVLEKDRMLKVLGVNSDYASRLSSRACSQNGAGTNSNGTQFSNSTYCSNDTSRCTSCNVYEENNDVIVSVSESHENS